MSQLAGPARTLAIPRGIWVLGFVSLLMDVSSEMIHALLPVFLVGTLGASTLVVGLIEGVAEATANITKVFSGALSDWLRRRKLLAVIGYGLGAASKPLFALAGSVGMVVAARFIDRVGKGIRGAPRDALVADIAPPELRGASFGLRQTLDTVGAFVGPLAAIALMALTDDRFRVVFWIASIPAALASRCSSSASTSRARHPAAARPPPTLGRCARARARFWASSRSAPCSLSPVSARRSWCCARSTWALPWGSCPRDGRHERRLLRPPIRPAALGPLRRRGLFAIGSPS